LGPDIGFRVTLEATVAPSEDPGRVLGAILNVLGGADHTVVEAQGSVRVESSAASSLDNVHDQLRDRQVRGAARKRLLAGRTGSSATVVLNRQAAAAGVVALCDNDDESPLGPMYLTVRSERLDDLIQWLTDYPVA
jgi:predicted RNA binding protein with dsRBD fold (UPF0201 family)